MDSLSGPIKHFAVICTNNQTEIKRENIFYSPLSIMSAFGMLYLGSRGNNVKQLQKAFTLRKSKRNQQQEPQRIRENSRKSSPFKVLTNKQTHRRYELNVPTGLYGRKEFSFLRGVSLACPTFHSVLVLCPRSPRGGVAGEPGRPHGELYPRDIGLRHHNPRAVVQSDTHLKLEDKLTAEKLLEWTSSQNMWKSQVDLHLPRFKVEETYDLKDMLVALGVVDAFSSQDADLSGMTRKHRLAVSKALHKSFVEVNEEGTEAAAATGIVIRETAALHYERFHCDHAFLFFIRHNKTNSILFLGRVSSP
ncbi:Serpin B13 [Camelus dromedarius]|uniref:Serpin B13 n=1 Tax=Camelus dromedarius TaxID=9838 RepID=A0A5N4CBU3_CAMDR|nr:Serpin B13 [Camelus dromedarius]